MASHCLSVYLLGLCVLCYSSLQPHPCPGQEACIQVPPPVQRAIWQPWGRGLQQLATLMHRARHCIPRLLWHSKWESSLVLLSLAPWAYYGLARFHGENDEALELPPRAVLQQAAASLLVRCLDRPWVAMGRVGRAMWGCGLRPPEWARVPWADSKDWDAVTAILPATPIPFSQRFPGPDPATLSRLPLASISLCLMFGDKNASGREGGCGFGAPEVPISTRFQNSRTSKMASKGSSRQALAQLVKVTCVLIILLYIHAVSLFAQILK